MRPILKKLQKEYKDRVFIQIVNVDLSPALRAKYDIKACPTFILFKKDKEVARKVGALSEEQLREMIGSA